jgi:hypothetical protein
MSVFGRFIGKCDWCGSPQDEAVTTYGDSEMTDAGIEVSTNPVGIELYKYNGKDVCADCKELLKDYGRVEETEEAYQVIHDLIKRANENYPTSAT